MRSHQTLRTSRAVAAMGVTVGLLAGCTGDPSRPPRETPDDRQAKVLADPFGYGATPDEAAAKAKAAERRPDISGGGLGDFDRPGFKRDLDFVLNP